MASSALHELGIGKVSVQKLAACNDEIMRKSNCSDSGLA